MANISAYLAAIQEAIFGEEVRGSIHDAIEIINLAGEKVLTLGTAVDSPSSSIVGYFSGSLYINTDTYDLWVCDGTAWVNKGCVKGERGLDGNKMLRGSVVTGKSKAPTIFTVPTANVNDFYMNTSSDEANTGNIYSCTQVFPDNTSAWVYEFTMVGGGSGGASDWVDLENKPFESLSSDFEVPTSGTDLNKLKLSEEVTDKLFDNADTVEKIQDATSTTEKLTNAYAVQKFANKYTERVSCVIPAGENMIGEWQDEDPEDWVIDDEHFLILPEFYESDDETVEFTFLFDTDVNQPIYLGGYQYVSQIVEGGVNCGGLCIVLGNVPENNVKIAIDVTHLRKEENEVTLNG